MVGVGAGGSLGLKHRRRLGSVFCFAYRGGTGRVRGLGINLASGLGLLVNCAHYLAGACSSTKSRLGRGLLNVKCGIDSRGLRHAPHPHVNAWHGGKAAWYLAIVNRVKTETNDEGKVASAMRAEKVALN